MVAKTLRQFWLRVDVVRLALHAVKGGVLGFSPVRLMNPVTASLGPGPHAAAIAEHSRQRRRRIDLGGNARQRLLLVGLHAAIPLVRQLSAELSAQLVHRARGNLYFTHDLQGRGRRLARIGSAGHQQNPLQQRGAIGMCVDLEYRT